MRSDRFGSGAWRRMRSVGGRGVRERLNPCSRMEREREVEPSTAASGWIPTPLWPQARIAVERLFGEVLRARGFKPPGYPSQRPAAAVPRPVRARSVSPLRTQGSRLSESQHAGPFPDIRFIDGACPPVYPSYSPSQHSGPPGRGRQGLKREAERELASRQTWRELISEREKQKGIDRERE